MARKEQTTAQKARAIATTANWLADILDGMDDSNAPDLVRAVDGAYRALQVLSETHARNHICAMLSATASRPRANGDHDVVRGFIAGVQNGDEFRVDCTPRAASESAIDATIDAWARAPGEKKRGQLDKWEATALLLRESGFGHVEASALRKAWDRRNK